MSKLKKIVQWEDYILIYALIIIAVGLSYPYIYKLFVEMGAFGYVMDSPLKFNFIILLGVWGGLHHFIIPVKNKYLDIVVLFMGFVVIVLILRFFGGDGMKTIFGYCLPMVNVI